MSWYRLVLIVVHPQLRRKGRQGKRTRDRAQTQDLRSIVEFQPCEPPIPVEILCPQLPLSTGHECAAIQQLLKTHASRLVYTVCGVVVAGSAVTSMLHEIHDPEVEVAARA